MSRRTDRVKDLLRDELSQLIARQIKDPRLNRVISITRVDTTSDLRSARVYISVMGSAEDKQTALEGIQSAATYLRRELRSRLSMKHTPFMTFALDDSLEEAARVLRVMDGLNTPLDDPVDQAGGATAPAPTGD